MTESTVNEPSIKNQVLTNRVLNKLGTTMNSGVLGHLPLVYGIALNFSFIMAVAWAFLTRWTRYYCLRIAEIDESMVIAARANRYNWQYGPRWYGHWRCISRDFSG